MSGAGVEVRLVTPEPTVHPHRSRKSLLMSDGEHLKPGDLDVRRESS
jgi:hypothetical protein